MCIEFDFALAFQGEANKKKFILPAKRFVTPASRVISDRSTGGAEPSLTSVIGRERVYSGSYERIMSITISELP